MQEEKMKEMMSQAEEQAQPNEKTSQIIPRRKPEMTVEDIMGKLEQGMKELFESEQYKTYLNTMSKFHNYSMNNQLLIAMQKPNATLVAGFNAWKRDFGRHVKKGEKGIRILQPAPYKVQYEQDKRDPETGKVILDPSGQTVRETVEVEKQGFKVASVFDISQTEGRELPTIGTFELTGDVKKYDQFMWALAQSCPVAIKYEDIKGGAKGYYQVADNYIALQKNMSQTQTVKTLIHEMVHQRLHSKEAMEGAEVKKDARTKEVEAESVAYAVCQHFGIDTSEYSFGYIAGWAWAKEMDALKESLQTIRDTAGSIITEIDSHLQEIVQVVEKKVVKKDPKLDSVMARIQVAKEKAGLANKDRPVPVRSVAPER